MFANYTVYTVSYEPWLLRIQLYGVFNKYTTLVLSHWKFATDKPVALQAWGLSLICSPKNHEGVLCKCMFTVTQDIMYVYVDTMNVDYVL